jgi:predicted metal-dependent phosphoesterase TrpH
MVAAVIVVDFHCHTQYSKDSLTSLEKAITVCRKKGIQRLVISDHNTIVGARLAFQLDPEMVIVGEEIKTQQGELLAAYVQEEIPAGLSSMEAIFLLRSQGAFISVSHPFDRLRNGHWELDDLERIAPLVDAIEIFNSRCMSSRFNQQAEDFARLHHLAGTAGSDAHAPSEIGGARVSLPFFSDADSLRAVISQARYRLRLAPPWVHFYSRYARWKKGKNTIVSKPLDTNHLPGKI